MRCEFCGATIPLSPLAAVPTPIAEGDHGYGADAIALAKHLRYRCPRPSEKAIAAAIAVLDCAAATAKKKNS